MTIKRSTFSSCGNTGAAAAVTVHHMAPRSSPAAHLEVNDKFDGTHSAGPVLTNLCLLTLNVEVSE